MDAQLRTLRQGRDGIAEYVDTEVAADTITLGSAADRHIQLLGRAVAADHAAVRRSGESLTVAARSGCYVTVNGVQSRSARLQTGDVIGIGGHRITVARPAPGFDAALIIEPDAAVQKSEFESAFKTDLEQTWLSKRRASWALFILLPLLILLIPLATALVHRHDHPTPTWVPDDTWWTVGRLIPGHEQAAGRRCEACHLGFFAVVQDNECRKCHNNIADHVGSQHPQHPIRGQPARCGECHEEHNSRDGSLIVRSNSLCVNCHGAPEQLSSSLKLAAVTGFDEHHHPAFKATVLRPSAALTPAEIVAATTVANAPLAKIGGAPPILWKPERVPVASGQETSNLKFSHAQHLDGNRVQRHTDSKPLSCPDCHVLSSDGEHFTPVTMATSCSGCHDLTFDEQAPDRQLPHGNVRAAILTLQDYFVHKFSDPTVAPESEPTRRRLPDSPGAENLCRGALSERAACRATLEAVTQFTRRGCVSCHVVSDNGGNAILSRFDVRPVRLVRDYFPRVRFSHRTHSVQKDLTGDAACLSCHAALKSEETGHLMLADRGKCLECHGDTPARDHVALACVSCHAYHSER